jgi:hypothetical protein
VSHRFLALAVSLLAAAPAVAQDIQYELVNNSALTLMEFYSSPVSAPMWGDDILGADYLAPGESGTVTFDDAGGECLFDLQFVMEDGSTIEGQADVCATGQFVLE